MPNRQKLLEAAARIYSEGGFRGATTRRIAEEAGVNEVTLFRLFGSKAELISQAVQCQHPMGSVTLPAEPGDPQQDLTAWCEAHLTAMRFARGFIRKTMADLAEHPEIAPHIAAERKPHFEMLLAYASKIAPPAGARERAALGVACTMLHGRRVRGRHGA